MTMTTAPKRAKQSSGEGESATTRGRKTRPLDALPEVPGASTPSAATPAELPVADAAEMKAGAAPADAYVTAAPGDVDLATAQDLAPAASAPASVELSPQSDQAVAGYDEIPDEIPDEMTGEIPDESDEWSVADQPTVVMSPQAFKRVRPAYLDTDELQSWPPTPRRGTLGDVTPPIGLQRQHITSARPSGLNGPQLANPGGRRVPAAPPAGDARAMMSNPRMHRFQELRRQRVNHEQGERASEDNKPVAEVVRQWWADLRPGLQRALAYQHEARASGMHPIPAHEPTARSRLGDAFGYLATSARDLAERASNAAGPRLKQLHERAERAAQAFIQRFEASEVRQQGPLLGPGRIAVFFRPAVTVGQAQRLLAATQARPMRIIPRKHGFLAWVKPGTEAEVSERLRKHPYVNDVIYLDYDEYGDPLDPTEPPAEG
jgi:hypothetical protein